MIEEGISKGVYAPATDNMLKDLKTFRDFLYRNFKNDSHYKKMLPASKQPAWLCRTAKTHNFDSPSDVNLPHLKSRPIIAQVGTYTNTSQVIADYLKPLCSDNEVIIRNTQDSPEILKQQTPLADDEEYVSYDFESLFTNIPINETI